MGEIHIASNVIYHTAFTFCNDSSLTIVDILGLLWIKLLMFALNSWRPSEAYLRQ